MGSPDPLPKECLLTCSAPAASFADIAGLWQTFVERSDAPSIFVTPRWQETWWEQFGSPHELRLITVGPEDAPLGFAPMMKVGDTLSFLGDTDLFDYHDFVQGPCEPTTFYDALVPCLAAEDWHTLALGSLPAASPTLEYLPERLRAMGYEVAVEREDVVPGLVLPADWDAYMSALRKKDRHELRRKFRRLEAVGAYHLVEAQPETLEADVALFLDMMGESREEKRDFMVPEREAFFHRAVSESHAAGLARLFFLDLGGERVASALCFDIAGRRLLYNSGYRLEQRANSVSLLLKALTIEQAIEEGFTYYDFLRGDEQYKFHLGGQSVDLFRLEATR